MNICGAAAQDAKSERSPQIAVYRPHQSLSCSGPLVQLWESNPSDVEKVK